ncbi:hypothetical protein V8C34DRAFT_14703 [Trichoderma compactum]
MENGMLLLLLFPKMVCPCSQNGYSALVVCSMDRANPPMSVNLRIQQLPSLVQKEYAMVGGESSSRGNDSNYQIMHVQGWMRLAAPTTGQTPIKLSDPPKAQGSGATRANDPETAPGTKGRGTESLRNPKKTKKNGFGGGSQGTGPNMERASERRRRKLCRWEARADYLPLID